MDPHKNPVSVLVHLSLPTKLLSNSKRFYPIKSPSTTSRNMARPFQSFEDTSKVACAYYTTPGGCKRGNECPYRHEPTPNISGNGVDSASSATTISSIMPLRYDAPAFVPSLAVAPTGLRSEAFEFTHSVVKASSSVSRSPRTFFYVYTHLSRHLHPV
jgi:hypothetical protein